MLFFPPIHVKMLTIVGILTFWAGKFHAQFYNLGLSWARKIVFSDYLSLRKSWISWYFYIFEHLKFDAKLSWARKKERFPRGLFIFSKAAILCKYVENLIFHLQVLAFFISNLEQNYMFTMHKTLYKVNKRAMTALNRSPELRLAMKVMASVE